MCDAGSILTTYPSVWGQKEFRDARNWGSGEGELVPSFNLPSQACVSRAVFKHIFSTCPPAFIFVISFFTYFPHLSSWVWRKRLFYLRKFSRFTSMSLVPMGSPKQENLEMFWLTDYMLQFPLGSWVISSYDNRKYLTGRFLFKEKESPSNKVKHSFRYWDIWKVRLTSVVSIDRVLLAESSLLNCCLLQMLSPPLLSAPSSQTPGRLNPERPQEAVSWRPKGKNTFDVKQRKSYLP